jgi:hypothetical protein
MYDGQISSAREYGIPTISFQLNVVKKRSRLVNVPKFANESVGVTLSIKLQIRLP